MKKFKELVGLLGKRHLPIDDTKLGQQANALYLYVRRVANPTDQGGAKKLKLSKSSSAYRKVKHKLKYALLDGITAVAPDAPAPENRPEASLRCWSSIALARSNPSAYELLPRHLIDTNIQLTQEYDLLEASSLLTDVLADRPSVGPDIVHYLERSDYLGELGVAMAEVLERSFHITLLRNENKKGSEISNYAISSFQKSLHLINIFENDRMYFHIKCMELHAFLAQNQYLKVINCCLETKATLSRRNFIGKQNAINVLNINLLNAYTQVKKYIEGEKIALDLLHTIPKNKKNYAKTQESLILLCLRTGEFQLAYDYFLKYNLQNIGDQLPLYFSETIDIFKAYIYLFIELGQVQKRKEDSVFNKFRLSKFMNSFNFADKEKSTRNIQIVSLKFIYSLMNKDNIDPIDSALAMDKYAKRHLRRTDRKRSYLFLKGLIYLAINGFTIKNINQARLKYIDQLSNLPVLGAYHHSNLELIDYLIIFNKITQHLIEIES